MAAQLDLPIDFLPARVVYSWPNRFLDNYILSLKFSINT